MKTIQAKIGIVSGVGPLAGSDVLSKLLAHAAEQYHAVEDAEYPDVTLLSHGIAGVDNTGALSARFESEMAGMIEQLEGQGATVIGIACNTAHVYANNFTFQSGTTFVHLIDEVAKKAAENSGTGLLLTSSASKQQKLYQAYLEKYGVAFQETTKQQQAALDEAIGLVMAHKLSEAGRVIDSILQPAKLSEIDFVIAGCTELPIAINHSELVSGMVIIDSNQVLAEMLAQHYYAKQQKRGAEA